MQNLLQSLGWALMSSLWQMALLWVIYQFIILSFQKLRPRHKTSLAVTITFAGFGWFILTFAGSLFTEKEPAGINYISGIMNESGWNYFITVLLPYAAAAYLVILIAPVWQFIRNYRYVQTIRNTGLQKMDITWRLYVKKTAAAMGITKEVKIWLSEWVNSPVTIGYLKPIILIPVAALNNLTPHQLEAVILHELSHIYRHDYFINLFLSFIKTILYFNPFVNSFIKTIEKEREYSCDEMVLQFQYKPGEYASALLRLEQNKHRQMLMAAAGKNHDLLHRIESILGMRNKGWQPLKQLSAAIFTLIGVSLLHIFVSVNNSEDKKLYTLNSEVSPYYFFTGKGTDAGTTGKQSAVAEKSARKSAAPYFFNFDFAPDKADDISAPDVMNVNYTLPVLPDLSPEAESTVKQTVTATRKILEEKEWKEMEKKYAEVYNSQEKSFLKSAYLDEVKKIDWQKLEQQLRLSYEQINWSNMQEKINTSLAQIKIDSIKHSLSVNLKELNLLELAMKENNIVAIPDTEISLEAIHASQQKAAAQLEKIKAVKAKKIVRL